MPIDIFSNPTGMNLIRHSRNKEVWESERWVSRQLRFLELARTGIFERESPLLEDVISKSDSVTLIDFGGGSGWLYHRVKSIGIEIDEYVNVESMNLHNECPHENGDYNFIELGNTEVRLNRKSKSVILYLNSVIQYLESDSDLVEIAKDFSPTRIILEDVTLSRFNEFFALQLYYETNIPYRFVNQELLEVTMAKAGFGLSQKIPYNRNIATGYAYSFKEKSSDFQIGETVSLEFTKL